jgi:hypothetical protein
VTEREWLGATDPAPMLEFLRGKASDRKLRLFGCACCHRIWHLPDSEVESHNAVNVAERFADGEVGETELREAERMALDAWYPDEATEREQMGFQATAAFASTTGLTFTRTMPDGRVVQHETWAAIQYCLGCVLWIAARDEERGRFEQDRDSRFRLWAADTMRCVVGNPFRSVAADPAWRTPTVVALARQMYESREFAAMPILADALQDTGCDNADVLDHCRGDGPHVRGCWVVDLVLGKS